MSEELFDPLASFDKRETWSWKGRRVGSGFKGVIVEAPKLVQGRDFKTKDPATWPDGNPKMVVVIGVDINGEEFSVWANKPSALYRALVEAQKNAGERMKVGGTLMVKFTEEVPTDGDPQRLFAAKYEPPKSDDPFADNDEPPF